MSRADALYKLTKENEQLREEIAKLKLVTMCYAKAIVEPEKLNAKVLDSIKIAAAIRVAGGIKEKSWTEIPINFYVGAKSDAPFHYPKHRQVYSDFTHEFKPLISEGND